MSVIFNVKKPDISEDEWFRFLQALDNKLEPHLDNNDFVLWSSPTDPAEIRRILDELTVSTAEFLVFSKEKE